MKGIGDFIQGAYNLLWGLADQNRRMRSEDQFFTAFRLLHVEIQPNVPDIFRQGPIYMDGTVGKISKGALGHFRLTAVPGEHTPAANNVEQGAGNPAVGKIGKGPVPRDHVNGGNVMQRVELLFQSGNGNLFHSRSFLRRKVRRRAQLREFAGIVRRKGAGR